MAGLPLGEFEQFVLLALARLDSFSYAVPVQHELEERTGRSVSLGAVYKTLERLEAKRLVSSEIRDPTPERGGRRKKFYRLEPAGAAALKHAIAALRNLTRGLPAELEI